ncbi:protein LNK2 isoform X3 [Olea europaea var. sylvestris]|uniref:protein LNK2 isoform X3 n=1 Tax=Olea europaea var. sylvestris TaxID=158386 RepID=UPI000C1D1967|nr:protein LNK2 isoform X3 [Olea europaea var. sylvestris]
MFDWNDEELNIIWGEAGDSDDHIVPYPDQIEEKPPIFFGDYTKKELNQEILDVTHVEQKKPTIIRTEYGNELECSSKYDTGDPAIGLAPQLLNAGKADHDFMGPPISNRMTGISQSCSSKDDMAQFDKESEIFQSRKVGKEECDFVDYDWENIGSFDDLDRIFSNSDPIFGDPAVGNAGELWSSSKDVNYSTMRATLFSGDSSDLELRAIRNQSERFENEYLDSSNSFLPEYQNLNEITTAPWDVQTNSDMGGKSQVSSMQLNDGTTATDKGHRKKRVLKGRHLEEKSKVRQLRDLCGTWSSSGKPLQQFNMQYPQSMVNQHQALLPSQLQRPEPLKHKHSSGPRLASPMYGNMVNQCPTLSVLPRFHPGEGNYNPLCSGYEVSPNTNSLKNSVNAALKPPSMTPREKIEKLRRRQQMRAIIAIQKQQQKFDNQVSIIKNSTMGGGNVEVNDNVTSFASLDPNSPIEQDNSSVNNAVIDDCSAEGSILHRLQETIDKLDIHLRLCIRDSLYRLAQSAKQRQYSSDASSSNPSSKDDVLSKNEGNNSDRFTRMPDAETGTNPIDRTVAHLLFHRPLDFSGKPAEALLPVSAKLPYERKATSLTRYFLESSDKMQITSPHGSKSLGIFSERDHSKNSLCLETSENASNTEVTDEKVKKK